MTTFLHPVWVAVLVVGAAVAGGVVGAELAGHLAPASSTASGILTVTAAGTLNLAFPEVASWVGNNTPGASAPTAAQQYQGSIAALNAVASLHQRYDVAASADFRLIPQLLEPAYASWEVVFASSPLVLAYNPSAISGINSTNWWQKIEAPHILLGVANASVDPNGYNAIFTLELEGMLLNHSLNAVYGHFFTSAPGSFAVANPASTSVVPETSAASLLASDTVQAFLIYRSYALSHHLAFVSLDPKVDLGSFDGPTLSFYAQATTTILTASGGSAVVTGAPVAYAVTVPTDAQNSTLGEVFVEALLSPVGQGILTALGFTPIFPAYADRPSAVPSIVAPWITALPAPLAQDLPPAS